MLEQTLEGIGSRSARHVLNRADMLVLETLLRLATRYRHQLMGCLYPSQQQMLPGFRQWLEDREREDTSGCS